MKKKKEEKVIIPESFEIEAKDYLSLIKNLNLEKGKLLNDLKVYSKVISLILTIPMKAYEGKYYISLEEIQKICMDEFQHLSKNWKDKK